MFGGGKQLAFEREQSPSNDVGLADLELLGEPVESLSLVGDEIDLNRRRFSNAAFCHDTTS